MCLFCMPFTLVKLLLKNWPLGDAMCRLIPWLQAVNVFASTMTITAIALDRSVDLKVRVKLRNFADLDFDLDYNIATAFWLYY